MAKRRAKTKPKANPIAAALAMLRAKKLSKARRAEIAKMGGLARQEKARQGKRADEKRT